MSAKGRHSQGLPVLHLLEPRRLFAITAQIVGGQLQVVGSDEGDVVTFAINATSGDVEVSSGDQSFAFDPADFTSVLVEARDGDDEVNAAALDVAVTLDGGLGRDSLTGGTGGDALLGREDADSLNGGDGNDTLDGNGGNDLLNGSGGDDELFGRAGADVLIGGLGTDLSDGGSGADLASYAGRGEDLELSLDGVANDGADGENDQLVRIENLTGGSGDDDISGNGLANVIDDGDGADTVRALGGNDVVTSQNGLNPGDDSLDGGSGDDTLNGGNGADTLIGAAGNDHLNGGSANNVIHGGSGNDTFFSVPFATDSIFGEAGDDSFGGIAFEPGTVIDAGSGDDTFNGNSFMNLQFFGRGGNDTVTAEFATVAGSCVFSGGSGNDRMNAVAGGGTTPFQITLDDVANDGRTGETHDIRSDFEHVAGRYYEQVPGVPEGDVRLDASMLNKGVTLEGGNGADTLIGGSAADLLIGAGGRDSLVGNAGEDVLRGGAGNDRLFGGAGSDSFNGGIDQDFMDADDGEVDLVNGSSGLSDEAEIDEGTDIVTNVETTS